MIPEDVPDIKFLREVVPPEDAWNTCCMIDSVLPEEVGVSI